MINAQNENQDILGDVLKTPGRGYDPYQWQAAANGQAKNRVLCHQDDGLVVEHGDPLPPVSRLVEYRLGPGLMAYVESHGKADPFLFSHREEILKEAESIYVAAGKETQTAAIDAFNEAVTQTCQRYGEPLTRPAPLPAPLNVPTSDDWVKVLESEARKVRTEVGQDYAPIRQAIIEMTPAPKRRK